MWVRYVRNVGPILLYYLPDYMKENSKMTVESIVQRADEDAWVTDEVTSRPDLEDDFSMDEIIGKPG